MAYTNLDFLGRVSLDLEEARAWSAKAVEVADELNDAEIRAEALISARNVEGALELARREGLEELVADCLFTLAVAAAGHRAYDEAHEYVEAGVDHCVRHGNDLMLRYLLSEQALLQLDQGLWIERLNGLARSCACVRSPRRPESCRSSCSHSFALAAATRTRSRRSRRHSAWRSRRESSSELLQSRQRRPKWPGSRVGRTRFPASR